jgi:hypothetical protein
MSFASGSFEKLLLINYAQKILKYDSVQKARDARREIFQE